MKNNNVNNNNITRELSDIARDYQASQIKCNELYTAIGKAYYENNKENPEEAYKALFSQVDALHEQQDKMETRRKFLNGIVVCTNCKADNNVLLSFCGSCGTRLPHKLVAANDGQTRCTNCGNVMAPDQAFCGNCGAKAPEKPAPVVEEVPPVPVEAVEAPVVEVVETPVVEQPVAQAPVEEYYSAPVSNEFKIFCSNCGTAITNPNAAFCPECGTKVAK